MKNTLTKAIILIQKVNKYVRLNNTLLREDTSAVLKQ